MCDYLIYSLIFFNNFKVVFKDIYILERLNNESKEKGKGKIRVGKDNSCRVLKSFVLG